MDQVEEVSINLAEYKEQLAQVEALLLEHPDNEEYQELYTNLEEVIALAEDVQRGSEAAAPGPSTNQTAEEDLITMPPSVALPSVLPPQVAQQIRVTQQKAALLGQAPAAWAIGAPCQALYSDGKWYDATVKAVTIAGQFVVSYEGYSEAQEVALTDIRPRPDSETGYTGVRAPKRQRVSEAPVLEKMPAWLEFKSTDDEKTKERKRKLQKSYRSKQRFQKMDLASQKKQKSWQNFISGKKKKKVPLVNKESIFRANDGGKVGVVGGSKLTDFKQPKRHTFEPTVVEDDDD